MRETDHKWLFYKCSLASALDISIPGVILIPWLHGILETRGFSPNLSSNPVKICHISVPGWLLNLPTSLWS